MKKTIALLLVLALCMPAGALAYMGMSEEVLVFNQRGENHALIPYAARLLEDGSILWYGDHTLSEMEGWSGMQKIMLSSLGTVGLTKDGRVVLGDADGLAKTYKATQALKWKNIVELEQYYIYLYGIDESGTLHVTAGDDANKKLWGHHKADGWKNVADVVPCQNAVFALLEDGTVRVCEPLTEYYGEVSGWTDIVQLVTTDLMLFGLRSDGTVVQAGWYHYPAIEAWTDVQELIADNYAVLGAVKTDGTVIGFSEHTKEEIGGLEGWTGAKKIIAGKSCLFAIDAQGGLLQSGAEGARGGDWHDLVDIWIEGDLVAGLRADGAILYKGKVLEPAA